MQFSHQEWDNQLKHYIGQIKSNMKSCENATRDKYNKSQASNDIS